MGCNCGARSRKTVYVLSYEDGSGRKSSEHPTRAAAEVADARQGGGGVIRPVQK
jgi:hypothetical protein